MRNSTFFNGIVQHAAHTATVKTDMELSAQILQENLTNIFMSAGHQAAEVMVHIRLSLEVCRALNFFFHYLG